MRIILATTAPTLGGVWRHQRDLALGFRARGHDVIIAGFETASGIVDAARADDLDWLPIQLALGARADVFHLHLHDTFDMRVLPILSTGRLRAGRALVMTEHLPHTAVADPTLERDPTLPPSWKKPAAAQIKFLLKRAHVALVDRVIVPSTSSSRFLARRYHLNDDRLRVVHNGIPVGPDPGPSPPADRLRVVSVGALGWRKGNDLLLAAIAEATESFHLTIVGEGPLRSELERQAATLPAGTVAFTGWLPDVTPALLAADVLCLASRAESSSYVLLEAMACGRTTVATTVDGPDEIVAHGETGILVPPEDVGALSRVLDELAVDRDRAVRMGRAAHLRVTSLYGLENMLDKTLAVYAEAA